MGKTHCPHRILADNGPQDLPLSMQRKYPNGVRLATCKSCRTTKLVQPFKWPKLR